jgi:ketosteroid isomerase-like protein
VTPPETNVERLEALFEDLSEAGIDALLERVEEICDPDVEFSPAMARQLEGEGTYRGFEGVRTYFAETKEVLSDLRYTDGEFRAIGDDVLLVYARLLARGRGSDLPIEQELGVVCEFRDGLIRRYTAYITRDEALRAAQEAAGAQA